MSEIERRITEEEMDSYLEGNMAGAEKAEFERRLAADAEASQQVEVYRVFESRLNQAFAPPNPSAQDIERLLGGAGGTPSPDRSMLTGRSRRKVLLAASGMAAAVAWAVVFWQWNGSPRLEPYFQPTPLARIYRQTVARGFRPYYFCEDEQRFTMTFLQRQDVPLQLEELPADRQMVGLSYLGGLSRDTTAMLGYAGEHPVIVFIDRRQDDQPAAAEDPGPDLHVHRKELGDLVMYEVTPLESPWLLDYLRIPDDGVG